MRTAFYFENEKKKTKLIGTWIFRGNVPVFIWNLNPIEFSRYSRTDFMIIDDDGARYNLSQFTHKIDHINPVHELGTKLDERTFDDLET